MDDTNGAFPDDVPVADAVEQQRATADVLSGYADEDAMNEGEMPLEASASDWQEQHETVDLDEPDR